MGRIRVQSEFLARGYWRQPEATRAQFLPDPHAPHARTFLTADLGRWLPDGNLEHLGRADQLVKIAGQRVPLADVEAALLATALVTEAAVTAPPAAQGAPRLVAYIAGPSGRRISPRELRRKLVKLLPGHMIPDAYVTLPHLPRGPGGKADRNALPPAPARAQTVPRPGKPRLRGRLEQKLAGIWRPVLGVSAIDRKDDFFELGGSSVQSAEVLLRIEETFDATLPPSTLAEHSTIEQLAQLVSERFVIPSSSPLVTLRAAKRGQPLFLIHTGQGDVLSYGLLTRRLAERPIYGLQSVGLQGESWPLMTIPAMARRYLPEIQTCAPQDPCCLPGPVWAGWWPSNWPRYWCARVVKLACWPCWTRHYPLRPWRHPLWRERLYGPWRDAVRDGFRILRWRALRAAGYGQDRRWLHAFRRFVSHMNSRAYRRYRPAFYPGTLTLFLTAQTDAPAVDTRPLMKNCAREVRTFTVPGKRANLFIRPAVEVLAGQLEAALESGELGALA